MTVDCAAFRVLHLYANYKWTGPADPAIRAALGLRRLGLDVMFAQAGWTLPAAEHRMAKELGRCRMPVVAGLELRRHFQPFSVRRDARRLVELVARDRINLVHTHQRADHLIAALGLRRTQTVLVRTLYDPEVPPRGWRERLSFKNTDGVVVPTQRCAQDVADRFGLLRERVLLQEPPVNWRRFHRMDGDLREKLGLKHGHVAIGVTARIQPHRRFDLLWDAARIVVDACPEARFVLLGRGNERDVEQLVTTPVREKGLDDHVLRPGYLYEPDYSLALRSLQAFLFLVPGSDGTCRAVREAMAVAVPIVVTQRGLLPDLAEGCGFSCAEEASSIAQRLIRLVQEPELREALGAAALRRVKETMDPESNARRLAEFYEWLSENPR